MLLLRIRLVRSYLKSHSHSIGLSDMNACLCNNTVLESALHYITQCPNFAEFCLTIYYEMEQHFIPNFKKLSYKRKYEISIYGYEPSILEIIGINSKITKLTQTFILKSKRFYNTEIVF